MKLKDRIKTYNFWISLASALYLLINQIGKMFNFSIDESLYNNIITSICSIFVLFGIIVIPQGTKESLEDNSETDENQGENSQENLSESNKENESDEQLIENNTISSEVETDKTTEQLIIDENDKN